MLLYYVFKFEAINLYIYILIYINKCIVYSSSVSTEFAIINFLGSEIC